MLRSFRVSNHRSIRDEQELVLVPAYDKGRAVVPVAAMFGANAAGKSNVLDALRFLQVAVRESYRSWEPGAGVPRTPFRLDADSGAEPSTFVVDLVLDGVRHVYGISMDSDAVTEEWLYSYPQKRRRVIFERDATDVRFGSTVSDDQVHSRGLSVFMRDNGSMLGMAAMASMKEVQPVYEWFRAGLRIEIHSPGSVPRGVPEIARLANYGPMRDRLSGLLREADVGIEGFRVDEVTYEYRAAVQNSLFDEFEATPWQVGARGEAIDDLTTPVERSEPRRVTRHELRFLHGKDRMPLGPDEQSAGTLAWLDLALAALDILDRGGLLCVDEIDASLHPRLTAHLIGLFKDVATNPNSAQLIFTSHDASLLGTALGEEVLARDEIWFVEKDDRGATTLFPLTDFKPRTGENRERRYLGGSYGAVPVLSDVAFQRVVSRHAGAA